MEGTGQAGSPLAAGRSAMDTGPVAAEDTALKVAVVGTCPGPVDMATWSPQTAAVDRKLVELGKSVLLDTLAAVPWAVP